MVCLKWQSRKPSSIFGRRLVCFKRRSDFIPTNWEKMPNGSWLTVKSTPQSRHKILWQVSSTQWIINPRLLTWFKTQSRAWNDYITGADSDFSKVGVKAIDDHTVGCTLARPEPYWNSKTTNSILFPVNEEFLNSKGKDFGTLSPDSILYSGPYLLKRFHIKIIDRVCEKIRITMIMTKYRLNT